MEMQKWRPGEAVQLSKDWTGPDVVVSYRFGCERHQLQNHRIESFRLEKTFKIIKSNHCPSAAKATTKPCHWGPHLHGFRTLPGIPPFHWQPVPIPPCEEIFTNIQSKPLLMQLKAITSGEIQSILLWPSELYSNAKKQCKEYLHFSLPCQCADKERRIWGILQMKRLRNVGVRVTRLGGV